MPPSSIHMPGDPLFLRVSEACRMIGVGRTKLYELVASGHVTARKIGSRTLIEMASIRAFAASLPTIDQQAA